MADLKVVKMAMKVDLQCSKCYDKIRRELCRFPQVRDQVYDEENNRVLIRVVCCSPECIKEKIIRKAGATVKSIEIVPDEKPNVSVAGSGATNTSGSKQETPNVAVAVKGDPKTKCPPYPPPEVTVVMYPIPIGVCCCCCCYEFGRGPMCYHGCRRPACECQGGHSPCSCEY